MAKRTVSVKVRVSVRGTVSISVKVRVCTDYRIPYYELTAKCRATCAKYNGIRLYRANNNKG